MLTLRILTASFLTAVSTTAFTITMSTKTENKEEGYEEGDKVRHNLGHIWIFIKERSLNASTTTVNPRVVEDDDVDTMSVVWYLGAFGGLIAFFLVVTCSEWCCNKHIYERRGCAGGPLAEDVEDTLKPQTPPPPYHLFAPPPYQEAALPPKASVYVVPVPS